MNTKNNIFFSLLVSLTTLSFSCNTSKTEEDTPENAEEISECNCQDLFLDNLYNHFYLEERTLPFTGHCKEYDTKGKLKIEKDYVKGKLHGTLIKYYPSGIIREETEFDINFQHGESKSYDESGQLIYHAEFYKGEFKKNLLQ